MAVVEGGPYFLGRLQAASMMMPAKQGFEADDVAVAKVDLCLIEWEDPVVAEGLARLAQHGFSAFCSLAHFGAKFADDPRALRLRRIERQVCALEDQIGRAHV